VITGKTALPVGREKTQRIPALAAPGIRHLSTFQ